LYSTIWPNQSGRFFCSWYSSIELPRMFKK